MNVEGSKLEVGRSGGASRAVFLSYASQDAEAAKKICDALRSSGVEVWFDAEGGLEHGDEWDAKIRRQIKECVLFIPVISANTQAREEGYFRIEWDLAVERARGIASGVAFILPVVVDDTREPDALVPDRFRSVQWTKLRGGELTPEVKQRFLKLWSHRAGVVKHATEARVQRSVDGGRKIEGGGQIAPAAVGKPGMKIYAALAAAVVVVVALIGWWFTRGGVSKPGPIATSAKPEAVRAPAAEFPRDPDLRRAHHLIYSIDAIAEDYALAEDLVKPLLASRPNDPETVTVAAEVSQEFLTRGFDTSETRRAQVQSLTERAVRLAPDSAEALAALGRYLHFINAQPGRAEELLRRAIELKPGEPRFYRTLYLILSVAKPAEADAFGAQMAAKFPAEPLVAYDIARRYKDADDLARAEEWFDKTLAIAPVAFAMTWKAWYMLEVHADVAGMKAWLDRVPERQRANTRVINAYCVYALLTGDTKVARQLLEDLTDRWLTDFDFVGPKALLLGDVLRMEGREELAHVQYEAALTEVRNVAARDPTDMRMRRSEFWILLALGRRDEARTSLHLVVQAIPRPYRWGMRNFWWTSVIRGCLLLDEREQALTLIKEGCTDAQGRLLLRNLFRLDPQMAKYRDDPEIKALFAEPVAQNSEDRGRKTEDGGQKTAAAPVDEKSVAVLAFANLSDDKANEYFSDGISEELLNVLAKVPGLKVSARTSAFYFKGKEVPIPEIARQLGVAYVVEGSVRKQGDKVRITAQLIKAADGFHVWSDKFDRGLKDIFAVQDEIAGVIAKNLSLKLGASSAAAAAMNPEAFELYLQGRQAWNLRSAEGYARAEQLLHRAIELAPDFFRAQSALADVAMMRDEDAGLIGAFGQRNSPELAGIITQIQGGLAGEANSAEAYASLGNAYTLGWNFVEGERSFRRAIALNPNYASAHQWLAFPLFFAGRIDEALATQKRAAELDPLSPRILDNLGHGLRRVGRYREALAAFDQALALQPNWPEALGGKALACVSLGRNAEAVALARQLPADNPITAGYQISIFGQAGLRKEAEALLAKGDPAGNWSKAQLLLAVGHQEEALAALDASQEHLYPEHSDILLDPLFDPIRDDPRFVRFIATLDWTEANARAQAWRKAHPPETGGQR